MNENSPFLVLEQACEEALEWVIQRIGYAGLRVMRTFDLHETRALMEAAHKSCPCPNHGTEQCDCQMVVLLVYSLGHQPVSLVAHGHNGQTWFSVVDTPQQRADPYVETEILQALIPAMGKGYGVL
jgi:hypothetical protein